MRVALLTVSLMVSTVGSVTSVRADAAASGKPPVTEIDANVLIKLHRANQLEITSGKLAKDKGEHPTLRTFGLELIKDHTSAEAKVKAVASAVGVDVDHPRVESPSTTKSVADEQLALSHLKALSGEAFDKAFAADMAKRHTELVNELSAIERDISNARVLALVKELLPSIKEHARVAERLAAE